MGYLLRLAMRMQLLMQLYGWRQILYFIILCLKTPKDWQNSIIFSIVQGSMRREHHAGTLGELCAKPHPWLYLETANVGMGLPFEERRNIIRIEDSGAGICSLCAAVIPAIGIRGGNIEMSGIDGLCMDMCENLKEIEGNICHGPVIKVMCNSLYE